MKYLITLCDRFGLLHRELDYHLLRASMVLIFLFFGYQKWWPYEAQALIPYISNGPLIFWMYPVFGIRGATWFLGVSEWLFGALLFWGFWNKKAGVLGALGGDCFIRVDHDDHSVHARRLGGLCRRLSSNDRKQRLLDERLRPACRVCLSAQTRLGENVALGN
jgi:hypothetical protein